MASLQPVSFTSPGYDYGAELSEIQRRQQLAQALQQQAMEPIQQQQGGRYAVPISPWQGLAKIGQGAAAGIQSARAQQAQRDLSQKSQSDYRRMLAEGLQQLQGTPVSEDAAGNVTPAQPPNAAAAMGTFGSHPMGAQFIPAAMQQMQREQMANALGGGAPQQASQPASGQPGFQPNAQVPAAQRSAGGLSLQQWLAIDPTGKSYAQAVQHEQITPYQQATLKNTQSAQTETARHNTSIEAQSGNVLTETKRHHAAVEGDPNTVEQTAQAIASGKLAPLSGFALARPMAQNIMARVVQINPEFDPTQFQTRQKAEYVFASGKQGNTVRSFNVALSHLNTLDQLADGLNNGNTQLINKAANAYATQTGAPGPTNFESAKKIVADEIVKAIVGSGGGVGDREQAAKTISAVNSPAQLKGVIATYKELMRGQINGLRDQYKTGTGKEDFDTKFLSPQGKSVEHGTATGKTVKWSDL